MVGRAPGAARTSQRLLASGSIPGTITFLPVMPLRDYLGLIASCDGVVSVDGGVLHCSVALGLPTLGLFGPTDASIWFPYEAFGPFRVLHLGAIESSPDPRLQSAGCLSLIPAADVESNLMEILESTNRSAETS